MSNAAIRQEPHCDGRLEVDPYCSLHGAIGRAHVAEVKRLRDALNKIADWDVPAPGPLQQIARDALIEDAL